ncbi:MAG TPA: hypothetical protein VN442_19750 [Bryobacteraceae bacterium]|nr:hypothetical protein [Bryobacteraceae bacterium]
MTLYAVLVPSLRWLTLAGMLFLCARLLHFRLHQRYRIFFLFLLFSSIRSGVLMALDVRSAAYMKIWIVTEPVRWILCILLVLELYSLILERHRGLYTAGRWAMSAALVIALLSSTAILMYGSSGSSSPLFGFFMRTERALMFSLVVFLLLILWFLSRYPVVLSRNVLLHSAVYSVYFISTSLAILIRGMLGYEFAGSVNILLMATSAGCILIWCYFLTAAGEHESRKSRPAWVHGDEHRLLAQLDSLNATLLRVAGEKRVKTSTNSTLN